MRSRVLTAGAVLLTAAVLGAMPAAAQTVSVGDPHESSVPARLNLDGARYTLNSSGFFAKVTVQNLRAGTYSLGFNLTNADEQINVLVTRFASGKTINTITVGTEEEVFVRHCGGLDTMWKNKLDYITVHIPWRCLDNLRKDVKVQAFFSAGRGQTDNPADFIKKVKVRYN